MVGNGEFQYLRIATASVALFVVCLRKKTRYTNVPTRRGLGLAIDELVHSFLRCSALRCFDKAHGQWIRPFLEMVIVFAPNLLMGKLRPVGVDND